MLVRFLVIFCYSDKASQLDLQAHIGRIKFKIGPFPSWVASRGAALGAPQTLDECLWFDPTHQVAPACLAVKGGG
jgi:hypothetical protein